MSFCNINGLAQLRYDFIIAAAETKVDLTDKIIYNLPVVDIGNCCGEEYLEWKTIIIVAVITLNDASSTKVNSGDLKRAAYWH